MVQHLLLVPTPLEMQLVDARLPPGGEIFHLAVCGFGPLAAAARAAALIAQWQPESVLLLGIAGSLQPSMQIGAAYHFKQVACYGVGAGSGGDFQTVEEMGWQHWSAEPKIGDCLPLAHSPDADDLREQLLTVCAAASNVQEVAFRQQKFPRAVAEDMEGFGVALACRLAGVPLRIVRGISNRAGDRQTQQWCIRPAMESALQLTRQVLEL